MIIISSTRERFSVFNIVLLFGCLVNVVKCGINGKYYECDQKTLPSWCKFVFTGDAPPEWNGEPVEHDLSGRTADRMVIANRFDETDERYIEDVTPTPWTNGDDLVSTTDPSQGVTLSEAEEDSEKAHLWHYYKVFEVVAPLRDELMFHADLLQNDSDKWNKYTKVFQDCGVKKDTEISGSGMEVSNLEQIYDLVKEPQKSDHFLQFLEEGAIDLVCLAVPSLVLNRCDVIRGNTDGWEDDKGCDCWFAGYKELYGTSPEVVSSMFKTCTITSPTSDVTESTELEPAEPEPVAPVPPEKGSKPVNGGGIRDERRAAGNKQFPRGNRNAHVNNWGWNRDGRRAAGNNFRGNLHASNKQFPRGNLKRNRIGRKAAGNKQSLW